MRALLSLAFIPFLPLLTTAQSACAAVPSTLPTFASNPKFPDPFKTFAGTRVSTKAEWECRRNEISALFQQLELGPKPPKPSVTASISGTTITITCADGGKSISFTATLKIPSGTGPFPAVIALGGPSIPIPAGVATITYNNEDIAVTNPRGQGKFYTLYGSSNAAGGLIAWAWGASRIIDALELLPASSTKIDVNRLGVTGCSRNGKGAMISGAFDDRIKLTIPQEGGSGAQGCWRVAAQMKKAGVNVEDAAQIITGDGWFSTSFSKYAPVDSVPNLPEDHHMLTGLIAPRGLLVLENSGIDYLGPMSSYGCGLAGRKVYEALGANDSMGFSQVAHGTSHCSFQTSQQPELTAFINRFLLNQTGQNTNVYKTDKTYNFDISQWVDWTTPTLT